MKKLILSFLILAGFAMKALAYDFQSGDLLYSIISTDPPQVSVDGHVDGQAAQGELVIPAWVAYQSINYEVKSINHEAFWHCNGLTGTLVLPETLSEICEMAFADCTGLTGSLVLPQSLTRIKYGAFFNCSGFTGDLVIPNAVTELGTADFNGFYGFGGAFAFCTGFNHLELPESLTIVGMGCFEGCSQLIGQLVIPDSVTEIHPHAFHGCSGYSGTLVLSNALEHIGREAFNSCTGFSGTLTLPESLTEMGWGAFYLCTGLEDVVFPEHPITMDGACFYQCTGLTDIDIPDSWTMIRAESFRNCYNLARVHLPDGMTIIETGVFYDCISLSEINWPENLECIYPAAFCHCYSLTGALELPDRLIRVTGRVFDSCVGFDALVLGDSLKSIEGSFENTEFKSVTIKTIVPPRMYYMFNNPEYAFWEKDIPITVPCGTIEAYRAADTWRDFTNMREQGVDFAFYAASEDEEKGTVRILKEATCDDWNVKVEAIPSEDRYFLYWECDGEQVSCDNPYSFTLERNTYLIARFSGSEGFGEDNQTVVIYPNPTREKVAIEGVISAKVINTLGQQVAVATSKGESLTVDLNGLPAGIYFINVIDKEGRKCVRKVVKE